VAGFLRELKRRNVVRVAIAYLAVAWLTVQVVGTLVPMLGVPSWIARAILILLVAAFPVALIIAWAFELTPEGIKRTPNAAANDAAPAHDGAATNGAVSIPRARSRKWELVVIGALVVALGLALWDRDTASPSAADTAASNVTAEARPSIAVLPFLNLSSDPEQEYFSDGLAEELLNKLAKLGSLQVASRTSSFALKGSDDDVGTIAGKLGVAHVLEGSVRKSGTRLRITAQLIDGASGYHLWSETYERELIDIFAIQEEIATSVAEALSVTLGVAEREKLKSGTTNLEAYDEYLAGLSLLNEFGPTQTERGFAHVRRATELDPNYADAWGLLAASAIQLAYTFTQDFARAERDVEAAAPRALELNPNLVAAHAALAHVQTLRKEWAQADRGLRKALELPSDYVVSWDYAQFLEAAGYMDEALQYRHAARQAMPLNVAPAVLLAGTYHALGDDARSNAELLSAETLIGDQAGIRRSRLFIAMANSDTASIKRLLEEDVASTANTNSASAVLLTLLDAPETAPATLRSLAADAGRRFPQLQWLSTWAAYFGDAELAVELISKAVMEGPHYGRVVWAPVWRDTRTTAPFKELMLELELVDFWRARGWPTYCRPVGDDDFECF
jgi:TolB-like protein/Tfp pilus assembly protein PilF